ncbi:phenylalanine ammonia-lyase [Uncinocarpus reesii 1704]|uniref:Phenylalanine ammonia-lyase n=1 Tax=Uncinocarpus reesii (strain UAMH 1704) TaxID=336963 RepID=C4JN11_UNCRE|nr:phenylalanine ammonia-lyase [Uncinocarpus reesii 1704]EEP79373.1 phenylalanine ammonia-lyase [Uncinocarpus reesii 1704]
MLSKYEPRPHLALVRAHLQNVHQTVQAGDVEIDGDSLTIGEVLAVSRFGCRPYLTKNQDTIESINESVQVLKKCLATGEPIYGVNTGFGGSADARTGRVVQLQKALMQLLQSGILVPGDYEVGSDDSRFSSALQSHAMPSDWVMGTMLIRCNSVARGYSAVSIPAIEAILRLIQHHIVPVVPLRGTISASGDLMPLAYIVGAIEGNPGVHVRMGNQVCTADRMLAMINAPPITLGPKEGLGLVNGTAAAAALASLVMYETHHLALLAQLVTALAVEALRGSRDSFNPFIAQTRPHDGQVEAAANILSLLDGSRLAQGRTPTENDQSPAQPTKQSQHRQGLVQDRYALRTASQWIGPQLEDLMLADRQIAVELNSTSDNPLVDCSTGTIYTGGNFQATSVTSAMEKTRLALQMLGKLLFAQCTEMIDPGLNNGLPTNLVADDPSLSFTMKGVDINMAAYMAELAYLANPVSSHVQTAEMHNQAVNSLAFISARYSMHAVDIVSMMAACSLYVTCQALDLRVLQLTFLEALIPVWHDTLQASMGAFLPQAELDRLAQLVCDASAGAWAAQSRLDLDERCERVVDTMLPILLPHLIQQADPSCATPVAALQNWKTTAITMVKTTYLQVAKRFYQAPDTANYLGSGTRKIYLTVRERLQVPFHRGFIEHPTTGDGSGGKVDGREKKTVGQWISVIYEALRDHWLAGTLVDAFQS